MKIVILIILIVAAFSDCRAQKLKTMGREQAIKDLQIIKKSVEEIHPGLDRFGQKAGFDARYDSIASVLSRRDSVSDREFFRIVNPLVSAIRCGHVKFLPPFKDFPFYFDDKDVLPLIVRFDENKKLLIVRASDNRLKGRYIEEINGRPITEILRILAENMFVDGDGQTAADAQIEQYFSAWYSDFIHNSASFQVTLRDGSQNYEKLDLDGISINAWKKLDQEVALLVKKNELTFVNDSTAFLRVASFMPQHSNREFLKFLSSSFDAISKKPIQNLIIDLRGNEGGNDKLGKELYSYIARSDFRYYDRIELQIKRKKDITYRRLAYFPRFVGIASFLLKKKEGKILWTYHQNLGNHKPKRNAYQGKISFLVDGLSFSVTSEFLAVARSENRGEFIGEESGGAYSGDNSGAFIILKLPSCGFDIGIPLAAYYSAARPAANPARGILPDIEIRQTASDLLDNQDTILKSVLQNKGLQSQQIPLLIK